MNVPIKEGDIGKPISVANAYSVGPYVGLSDRVGVDWLNGGVSFNKVGTFSSFSVEFLNAHHRDFLCL